MNLNELREKVAKLIYPGEIPDLEVLKRAVKLATEASRRRSCKIVVYHTHPDCGMCESKLKEAQDAAQLS